MVRNPLNVLALAGLLGSSGSAIEVPKGFVVETVVAGLEAPTAFASTPDGRFFIAEQTGVLRVWRQGRLLTEPALVLPGAAGEAPQPIALALAPEFPHPPHLFVLHDGGPASGDPVLARYTVDGDRADPETRKVLLGKKDSSPEAQPMRRGFPGGALCFGPDGTLWVAVADRTAGDAGVRVGSFGGKIYCVQPDGTPPAKNPFRNRLDRRFHPVFATGVLDPSGMALQPPWEGGRVFFADRRGGRTLIHELVAGSNYGDPDGPVSDFDDESRAPRYSDETGGIPDVAGSAFCSRRSSWPAEWHGRYFFSSPSGHAIHALNPDQAATPVLYAQGLEHPVAMEFGADGSLLVLNRGAGWDNANAAERGTGSLIRIRYVAPDATPMAAMPLGSTVPGHRVALGLPADPRELPRSIKVGELYQRMAGAEGQHFGLVHSPWTRGVHDFLSMALPPGQRLRVTRDSEVLFPPGTVFVRTFNRYPVGTRLADGRGAISFETRLIVVGDPWGYGASYRWRAPHPTFLDNAEDADLVEEGELADVGFSRIMDHKAKRQVVHSIS